MPDDRPALSDPTRAWLVEQIADIIREFEEPDGSAEYPSEAAGWIIELVCGAFSQSMPRLKSANEER